MAIWRIKLKASSFAILFWDDLYTIVDLQLLNGKCDVFDIVWYVCEKLSSVCYIFWSDIFIDSSKENSPRPEADAPVKKDTQSAIEKKLKKREDKNMGDYLLLHK